MPKIEKLKVTQSNGYVMKEDLDKVIKKINEIIEVVNKPKRETTWTS